MKPRDAKERRIAIVDDDEDIRKAVHLILRSAGLSARTFASAEEFLLSNQAGNIACLIADIEMPGMSGLELQARLSDDGFSIPVIFITAYANVRVRTRAMDAGAVAFLEKPFNDDVLLDRIRAAIGTYGE